MSLKISLKYKMSCPVHPRYDPEKDGEGGIKGSCLGCWAVSDAYHAFLHFREKLATAERQLPKPNSSP